jgi:hypothetical protein
VPAHLGGDILGFQCVNWKVRNTRYFELYAELADDGRLGAMPYLHFSTRPSNACKPSRNWPQPDSLIAVHCGSQRTGVGFLHKLHPTGEWV